jgi:hypothetical protein
MAYLLQNLDHKLNRAWVSMPWCSFSSCWNSSDASCMAFLSAVWDGNESRKQHACHFVRLCQCPYLVYLPFMWSQNLNLYNRMIRSGCNCIDFLGRPPKAHFFIWSNYSSLITLMYKSFAYLRGEKDLFNFVHLVKHLVFQRAELQYRLN